METSKRDIYNTYLKISRSSLNKPFKYRKNFDDIDDDLRRVLDRLDSFFKNYPHINMEDYFSAPFKLWEDGVHIPISFYTKRKSLKAYSDYMKSRIKSDPDDEHQLRFIVDSLKFIFNFCRDNSIDVDKYLYHMDGNVASYLLHMKQHKVSIYVLFGYNDFKLLFSEVDAELKKTFFGDYYINSDLFYRKYLSSKKARKLIEKGLKKISQ